MSVQERARNREHVDRSETIKNQAKVIKEMWSELQSLKRMRGGSTWTDNDMVVFAKISTEGSYGDYSGCRSLASKLDVYRNKRKIENDLEV